jgi:glyoxylase-like metal-dependent hydrolase (beta-lactamase superfamily II)
MEVPIPRNPLKVINSYVIKADGRSLIIDTGMNRKECLDVASAGLRELDVDLNKADFFITHMHADHSGLISTLATDTSTIYISQADGSVINAATANFWEGVATFARKNGFPENELQKAIANHPGVKYSPKGPIDFHIMKDGNTIDIGDCRFKCIETPGHTKGHTCLYEPDKKLFVSGDHILIDITPNISLWSDEDDPLNEYLEALDKVYDLDVELVLPGHRRTFTDLKARIEELKRHHQRRADEVVSILAKGSQDACQVASQMSWYMDYQSWYHFPASQKWFATGETMAHIRYLEGRGSIKRDVKGQKVTFSLK